MGLYAVKTTPVANLSKTSAVERYTAYLLVLDDEEREDFIRQMGSFLKHAIHANVTLRGPRGGNGGNPFVFADPDYEALVHHHLDQMRDHYSVLQVLHPEEVKHDN